MKKSECRKCGNGSMLSGFMSLRCPICGEYVYADEADDRLLWAEHRLGLLFTRDGWRWLPEVDPPAWFIENVA
ncbi:MAG: hypothetical protein HZA22_00255 [Nitrospirae bacterium]|nr:hypothetical protein [Nitrospirota bacterium]MBI5694388.1 hypothetical protein [Nitrospirota bacterium]